jgi:hypothetical protein
MLYVLTEGREVNRTTEVEGNLQLFSYHIAILLSQEIFVFCLGELDIQNMLRVFFTCNNAELFFCYR